MRNVDEEANQALGTEVLPEERDGRRRQRWGRSDVDGLKVHVTSKQPTKLEVTG